MTDPTTPQWRLRFQVSTITHYTEWRTDFPTVENLADQYRQQPHFEQVTVERRTRIEGEGILPLTDEGLRLPDDLHTFDQRLVVRTPKASICHTGTTPLGEYDELVDPSHFGDPDDLGDPINPDLAPDRVEIEPRGEEPRTFQVALVPDADLLVTHTPLDGDSHPVGDRSWTCPGCEREFTEEPAFVTPNPLRLFCSRRCYEHVTGERVPESVGVSGP